MFAKYGRKSCSLYWLNVAVINVFRRLVNYFAIKLKLLWHLVTHYHSDITMNGHIFFFRLYVHSYVFNMNIVDYLDSLYDSHLLHNSTGLCNNLKTNTIKFYLHKWGTISFTWIEILWFQIDIKLLPNLSLHQNKQKFFRHNIRQSYMPATELETNIQT